MYTNKLQGEWLGGEIRVIVSCSGVKGVMGSYPGAGVMHSSPGTLNLGRRVEAFSSVLLSL